MITFQQLIQRLTQFWEKKGCVIHQGHDLEMGAGTFNPATFLRCLGPEPYSTAYVEPSRRPSDGRYGENPNRVQLFHQFQVIIKPSPPDIQKFYLQSLEAIGLKLKDHDIRFVHDDWESPTIGAWGLGWEVWCDGMEVSQFTYFQAIGSVPLKPISAEITYGLERLAMYIQGVDNIFDLKWNDTLTLRDISQRNEVEWSAYNFTHASTEMWKRHFEDFEKEAKRLAAENLPIPAYDFIIKASHAFNMLEARGVISVTERTGYIGRIRDLARLIAVEYVSSREKLGFPLVKNEESKTTNAKLKKVSGKFNATKKNDFLLEIGSEQLPATFIPIGCRNLEKAMRDLLKTHELSYGDVKVYATPRRLAVYVTDLAEGSATKVIEKKGPSASAPAVQIEGFAKSVGLKPTELENRDGHLFATVKIAGKSTLQILSDTLGKSILGLDFPKKMRWGNLEISYARPLHWIIALYGQKIVPFEVGEIASSRYTFGHMQLSPKKISLKTPKDYVEQLRTHKVLVNIEERKDSILDQLASLEKAMDGTAVEVPRVLKEVLYLTEWPKLAFTSFDPKFLSAPKEVLISEMIEHQRYFPVQDKSGNLKNLFVITADNTPNELIKKGNQKVLSARLSDGVFLYELDLKTKIEDFNKKLAVMTFQKDLGSVLDKVMRIVAQAQKLNALLKIADDAKVQRAALLCKADLASALVKEFPELQGTIGKYYALAQKENSEVASAIEEHWMPKAEDAPLPQTSTGIIVSLADKVDNLISYYSVGLKPSSSSDPYGLRRQAIGILKILISGKYNLNLKEIFQNEEILQFITSRAKNVYEEMGFKKDEIEASLIGLCINPYDQYCKIKALHEFRNSGEEFSKLYEVYKRAKGQLDVGTKDPFNPALLLQPAEKELYETLEKMDQNYFDALNEKEYLKAFKHIAKLQPKIATLFDTVKILDDDLSLRNNRIALLQKIFSLFGHLLDFSKIQN